MGSVSAPLGPRVLRAVQLHVLGQGTSLALAFLLTPLVVRGLGTEGYALYTLIGTGLGYAMLLTLGSSLAAQRYSAQHAGRGDKAGLGALLRLGLLFFLAASALAGAAAFLSRRWLAERWLGAAGEMSASASWVFACLALAAPGYFVLQLGTGVLYGLQRFKYYNALKALETGVTLGSAAALLWGGLGLREVAAAFVLAQWLLAALSLLPLAELLSAGEGFPAPAARAELMAFSAKNFLAQLFWLLIYQGDRLFIGALLPLSQLGYYAVASTLVRKFNVFCNAVADSTLPMFAELHGRGEQERLRRLYLKANEFSLFLILPVSILSFALIPQFMTVWLGGEFSLHGTWPFRLLLLGNVAYLSTVLPYYLSLAKGFPALNVWLMGGKAALLLALWPLCIPRWGLLGAAAGLLAAEVLGAAPFIRKVHRDVLGLGWSEFWSESCWRPVSAGLALGAAAWATHAWADSWLGLFLFLGLGLGLFYGAGYRLLDAQAQALLKDWLRAKGRQA